MSEPVKVSGMVLSTMPMGEFDRRVVLLTTDRGKINGFARGARRPGNSMMAASQPFVYGDFMVYEGRSAYTFASARVIDYFEDLRTDFDAVCYGSYFLEMADYFARENEDDRQMLALLYLSVKALISGRIPFALIRCIYELRMLAVNGICPDFFSCMSCSGQEDLSVFSPRMNGMLCKDHADLDKKAVPLDGAALYTAQYIVSVPVKNLFAFTVSDRVLGQLRRLLDSYLPLVTDRRFRSLDMLKGIEN